MSRNRLFIPGPVDVRDDVLAKMGTQMIGHRTKDASILQKSMHDAMQKVLFTENRIIFSTSSGSGLMESAIISCVNKRVAVFSIGAFGDRWAQIASSNGRGVDKFKPVNPGDPTTAEEVNKALATGKYDVVTVTHNETSVGVTNPVEEISKVMKKYPDVIWLVDAVSSAGGVKIPVDELGIDVCITSTQKCLGLPPGLAIASVSKKAYEKAKTVENRGFYFDLVQLYEFIDKKDHQYPSTPSLSHYYALDYQLDYILNKEGLQNRFDRHAEMANFVRAWAKKNFALLTNEKYASNALTVIKNTKGFSVSGLNKYLATYNFVVANGYGDLKEKTFRIAHMADATLDTIKELLGHIDNYVAELSAKGEINV